MESFVNGFAGACVSMVLLLALIIFFAAVDKVAGLEYDLEACEALSIENTD